MCGILGFITSRPEGKNYEFFKKILLQSMSRGRDATGIGVVSDGVVVVEKAPMPASQFVASNLPNHREIIERTNVCIGHTRAPTVGDPKHNENNHPVFSDNWVMVHNGSVTGMSRLPDYKYKGEVDSEVLVSYIEKHGLQKGLPYVGRGTAAIAAINIHELNTVYLWRETNPIHLAYDDTTDTLFFASMEEYLLKGLANKLLFFSSYKTRELPENVLIKVTHSPLEIHYIATVQAMTTSDVYDYSSYNRNRNTPVSGTDIYRSNPITLVYNDMTRRWDNPDIKPPAKEEDEVKALKTLGYLPYEVARMNAATRKEILELALPGVDVHIHPNGTWYYRDPAMQAAHVKLSGEDRIQRLSTNKRCYIGVSRDTVDWIKLTPPNRGWLSMDGMLCKKWDVQHNSHFIIETEDAVAEGLIPDAKVLDNDLMRILKLLN